MNTTCNPREHPFCTGVCAAAEEHVGTREDMTDHVQAFAGTFDFDALKRKACCNSLLHRVATFT